MAAKWCLVQPSFASHTAAAAAVAKRQSRNLKKVIKNRGGELFSLSCESIFSNFADKMMNFSICFLFSVELI